jgi:hypothetical protein
MVLRYVADDSHMNRSDPFGRGGPLLSWPPTDSLPLFDTGDNGAGNGGNGYFAGSLIDSSYAAFEPLNMAQAGADATADAQQTNIGLFDQSAIQIAGTGGDGGNGNAAMGGSGSAFGSFGSDTIATGDNSAGNGGNGYFSGALIHAPVAVFDPINIAMAGFHGTADAHQSNTVQFHQGATQIAGVGGGGGSGNAAIGGGVSVSGGAGAAPHSNVEVGQPSNHASIASDAIVSGDNHAGNGGDGHFAGSLVDLTIAIYAPINIAVAGVNSTADAEQTNNVQFDQGAIQIAGTGGAGGHGNAALGGDFVMHMLADAHFPGHA